jgi:tRNA (cytidine/uridine-2'-O-)-methyltransferase
MDLNIVLLEPEIPQNTGTIARSCGATNAKLHLIKPLGFSVEDKYLKRAGLDYWYLVDIVYYENIEDFYQKNGYDNIYYCTKKATKYYSDVVYPEKTFLMFGKETKGLPEEILQKNQKNTIRIPMIKEARSLNLSNAVNIIMYEALRQQGFLF